jgi:epoxyqueuosine reductase QueG
MKTVATKEWIESTIREFVQTSPENSLRNTDNEKAWGDPLIGFANGADPIFDAYKEYVGPFHLTPFELFCKAFGSVKVTPDQLTVISWILPQTESTKAANRRQKAYPSERWARSRIFGENTNVKLREHVVDTLQGNGYFAVAPQQSPFWERKTSERYGFASTWSERHAAYAAGLGTFGLSDGLITPKGKAMRCGSVIANAQIAPTTRLYENQNEYCLFYSKGKCGACIERCPADAISAAGHDKIKCRSYLKPGTEDYVKSHYHFDGYGCGLCQTGVPCESKIPTVDDLG